MKLQGLSVHSRTASWICTLFALMFTVQTASAQDIDSFYDAVDQFMAAYVTDGLVDYGAIDKSSDEMKNLLGMIADMDRSALSPEDDQAFMVNAYNVLVIKNVVDNYPTNSPLEVAGFFDRIKFEVSSKKYTLNDFEKGELFKQYPDARFHFVLVCAAIGCPELISEAYRGETLDDQLEERTRAVLNNVKHVRTVGEKHEVSELFNWYEGDFTKGGTDVVGYINAYRNEPLDDSYKVGIITYDWQLNDLKKKRIGEATGEGGTYTTGIDPFSNLQAFTPSTLLVRGQFDVKVFNNLYTQTAFFDGDGNRVDANERQTFFTSIISLGIGYTPRLNFGLDLYPKAVRVGGENSSPFSVLEFTSDSNSRAALAAVAPKVKFVPFKKAPRLAMQVLLYLPVVSDLEGRENQRPFLDFDDVQTWVQAFYDLPLNPDWLLYLEGGLLFRFDSGDDVVNHEITYPMKALLNYFATSRLTLYASTEITPSAQWQDPSLFSTLFTQVGAGVKYQLTPRFEIETLVSTFPFGVNRGAGQTFNLGLRFVR